MSEVLRAHVDLAGRPTDIEFAPGGFAEVWARVRSLAPSAGRVGLAIDPNVEAHWPLPAPVDLDVVRLPVPAGEAAKTRDALQQLQDGWIHLRRDEPILAVGGGAVLDVVGFAAATLRRGLPWIAVPTTVVAMADASVGGKTAINHPAGKNLIGSFHPPRYVLTDVDFLGTLPPRDMTAGLAELYKVGRLADAELLALLRNGPPTSADAWSRCLHRAVEAKARLVEADERDAGVRRLLNYGHTIGHALETLLGNERVRHGEAVAIGMDRAAALAVARGLLDASLRAEQAEALRVLGLDVALPADVMPEAILETLGRDKKRAAGGAHTFILPRGAHGCDVVEDVRDEEILAALALQA